MWDRCAKVTEKAGNFSAVSPETAFLLRFNTLWENGRFRFKYWDEEFPESEFERIFARLNLLNRANEPLSRYSRGMVQKAAISFMLATRVPLIVLDEPTLGLDVLAVKEGG